MDTNIIQRAAQAIAQADTLMINSRMAIIKLGQVRHVRISVFRHMKRKWGAALIHTNPDDMAMCKTHRLMLPMDALGCIAAD